MSLVNCPKCGREGVSDNAIWCPNCRYNVKEHFYQQNLSQNKAELLKSVEESFLSENGAQKKISYLKYDFEKAFKRMLISVITLICCALLIYFSLYYKLDFLGKLFLLTMLITVVVLIYSVFKIIDSKIKLNKATSDMKGFETKELERKKAEALMNLTKNHLPFKAQNNLTEHICPQCGNDVGHLKYICNECGKNLVGYPKPNPDKLGDLSYMWCPRCGSFNLSRTSTKIGKRITLYTFCNNCNYNFPNTYI